MKKRTVVVNGIRTSVNLENGFWEALNQIADLEVLSTAELVAKISGNRGDFNLASAIRVHVLKYYQSKQPVPVVRSY